MALHDDSDHIGDDDGHDEKTPLVEMRSDQDQWDQRVLASGMMVLGQERLQEKDYKVEEELKSTDVLT